MYKFFAYLDRMKYIKRWSLMRSTREENIMEHSYSVVLIAEALALIKNKIFGGNVDVYKTVNIACYHEVSEVVTGDLPTPIKYFNPEIKRAYKDLENIACDKLLGHLPEELKEEYRSFVEPDTDSYEYKLVKIADRISAYLKCVEELKVGNNEFKKAKKQIEKDIDSCHQVEVQYFMKNIVPSFSLTLDELD
ncbi:MAG: 5'-deoxynucleotidase [Clostridia bacterium]|nr:5'-deoxynucleotidase [Clostridia bacterium]